jgi:hypothetical protein
MSTESYMSLRHQKMQTLLSEKYDSLENCFNKSKTNKSTLKSENEFIAIVRFPLDPKSNWHTKYVAAESTNSRVKWWSIFQAGVLVGVCLFQVSYLKRYCYQLVLFADVRFFEVKRVV